MATALILSASRLQEIVLQVFVGELHGAWLSNKNLVSFQRKALWYRQRVCCC